MKTLVESLFDSDIVKQNIALDVKTGYDIITKEISKKLSVDLIEHIRNAYSKLSKKGNILWTAIDGDYPQWARINFSVCINEPSTTKDGYGASVSFCLCPTSEGPFKKKSDDVGYLARVDIGLTRFTNQAIYPDYKMVWEDNGFKRFTTLKSVIFNEKNINKITDYVVEVCSKLCEIVKRDSDLILDIAEGRLVKNWYIDNLKKEMVV